MAYQFLSTVQSLVSRFNKRMQALVKEFGVNSPVVESVKSQLDVDLPDNYRLKKGVPQITRPAQIFGSEDLNANFERIVPKVETVKETYKRYEGSYQDYVEQEKFFKGTPVSKKQFIETVESIPNALSWIYEKGIDEKKMTKGRRLALEIMRTGKGERRKTYSELQEVIEFSKGKRRKRRKYKR